MTLAQGLAIKIAFGKPFKGLISSSCGIWKPNFVLVRQINCINLQNGGKCHLSSFKSATSERAALTSVTAPLPHISTERCHGRPDLQILITAWKMQGRRRTVTSKVQPKSRLGELTVPRLDCNERLYAQIRDQTQDRGNIRTTYQQQHMTRPCTTQNVLLTWKINVKKIINNHNK